MKKTLLFLLLLCALPLFSQGKTQPRSIDFTQALKGLDGKPITDGATPAIKITLSVVSVNALESALLGDERLAGADKFKMDTLARKIFENKAALLTAEDIALLKERLGKAYGALVVGAAWRLLDPVVAAE